MKAVPKPFEICLVRPRRRYSLAYVQLREFFWRVASLGATSSETAIVIAACFLTQRSFFLALPIFGKLGRFGVQTHVYANDFVFNKLIVRKHSTF